ncbi:hypothetical protein C8250_028875 [Streptomyces sp. So13.3]|uniref:hypothetical protein n=1 Tax=Streptomyces sp. So13.3 TaxID=2136173 RepID=UPI001105F4BA|nr:hypothetical protein [Streptomyces sp. So13.3]QNA75367.1 hypothetical protein C8250_028875 [Streptomyces sp. So13.3]
MSDETYGENHTGTNFIAEYFGHQVYPKVASSELALADQQAEHCPFLTLALDEDTACAKGDTAKGICTVSTAVEGVRYDWLVCPHRALDPAFMGSAARRLFNYQPHEVLHFIGAPTLAHEATQQQVLEALKNGERVLLYFQEKLGGELGIRKTAVTPELSFDWTLIEIVDVAPNFQLGRVGILELQTMDFHGSYKHALGEVRDKFEADPDDFQNVLDSDVGRAALSKKMEGPNLSNVFKRTFYQMAYKFQLAKHDDCSGCGFAIPYPVWQSWLRHLGNPQTVDNGDGTFSLGSTPQSTTVRKTWIFVFKFGDEVGPKPRDIQMWRSIHVDVETLIDLALRHSPNLAVESGEPIKSVTEKATQRIRRLWPAAVPRTPRRKRTPIDQPTLLDLVEGS